MQPKQDDRAQRAILDVTRRTFMQVTAGGLGAAALGALPGISAAPAMAAGSTAPETLVSTLYKSLSDEQKKVIAFGFVRPPVSAPIRVAKIWRPQSPNRRLLRQ